MRDQDRLLKPVSFDDPPAARDPEPAVRALEVAEAAGAGCIVRTGAEVLSAAVAGSPAGISRQERLRQDRNSFSTIFRT